MDEPPNGEPSHQPKNLSPAGSEDATGHQPENPSTDCGVVTFHPDPGTQQTFPFDFPFGTITDTTAAKNGPETTRFLPGTIKRRKLHQPTILQCLSQEGKAPTNPKPPSDKSFQITKVHDLRKRLVSSQAYTKAYQTHYKGGSEEACEKRRESFLSKDCDRSTTSVFGGDVEISAYALTRNFACQVWELAEDGIHPYPEKFACPTSAAKTAHFLFSRTPNPKKQGEFLRNGHFDLLLPEENLPQGHGELEQFWPEHHPPLFRVPCPKNGHCLFYAMAFLDDLLSPTMAEEIEDVSEDEGLLVATSSTSGSSSDASYH